jgi:hypothetical protein
VRTVAALAALVLSLGVVAGCAGDDEPDENATAAWADSFCTATLAWSTEVQRIAEDLGDFQGLSSAAISGAADQARDATDDFVSEVRGLGSPETEGGDEIESSLETLATEIEGEMDEIEDAVDDLQGLSGIVTAGRDVAASVSAMFVSLQRVFETFEESDPAGELETAFEQSDACDEIAS